MIVHRIRRGESNRDGTMTTVATIILKASHWCCGWQEDETIFFIRIILNRVAVAGRLLESRLIITFVLSALEFANLLKSSARSRSIDLVIASDFQLPLQSASKSNWTHSALCESQFPSIRVSEWEFLLNQLECLLQWGVITSSGWNLIGMPSHPNTPYVWMAMKELWVVVESWP